MKLAADDEIGLYDFAMGLWRREGVGTTFCIVLGQALLVRHASIVHCTSFDRILAAHAPVRKSGKLAGIPSSKCLVKPELMGHSIFIKPEPMMGRIDTGDSLWVHGRVMVPTRFGSWLAGIYARDMAWVFTKISIGRKAGSDVESRFRSVFSGVEYVKPTYQWQLQHWAPPHKPNTTLHRTCPTTPPVYGTPGSKLHLFKLVIPAMICIEPRHL
ncbi:hypothetical protein B0H14DRAFT_2592894 [Mycena olivaceomarginata]|nr:hypothetical protein B0H14DRAFT_2592894 [Mycena olivaceomarginata]